MEKIEDFTKFEGFEEKLYIFGGFQTKRRTKKQTNYIEFKKMETIN